MQVEEEAGGGGVLIFVFKYFIVSLTILIAISRGEIRF